MVALEIIDVIMELLAEVDMANKAVMVVDMVAMVNKADIVKVVTSK